MKAKDDCKPDLFEQTIPVWAYSLVQQTKDDKYSSHYLFLSLLGQVVYFHEADYRCKVLSHYYSYLQKFLKIGVLKTFAQFAGKYMCLSLFLISPLRATFLIRDSDIDTFLGISGNCQEHHFYRAPWNSCFWIYGTYL